MSCTPATKTTLTTSSCACNQPRGMSHVAWVRRSTTPGNILSHEKVTWAWAVGSWVRSLWHDRLGGCGKVQYELASVLVQPYLSLRAGAAGELARLAIVETPAAVADPDFTGPRTLPGHASAHRDAQVDGVDRGVGIARYHQRARTRRGDGQDTPGHSLIALGPAPVRADNAVEQDQFQRPGGG